VLVFESLELHSCYTSSVHSYLRSILTAGGARVGFIWVGLYTSFQPANAGDAPMFERFGVSI
jgi:hypothetical protein